MNDSDFKKTAAILLSRQPLHPCSRSAWVRKASQAMRWVARQKMHLLTSVGMQTWELLIVLAKREGVYQRIIIPAQTEELYKALCKHYRRQFMLNSVDGEFIPLIASDSAMTRAQLMQIRDAEILGRAQTLLPVSVRKNGSMQKRILVAEKKGTRIYKRYQIDYKPRAQQLGYTISSDSLNRVIRKPGRKYITHWTRSARGPWPDERAGDYYCAILDTSRFPRDACATLAHIIETGCIRASSRHMPDNIPTVSFSGISPEEFAGLMRWRARYREMSFEPFGIGIEREYALSRGIQPVIYYEKELPAGLADEEMWRTQSAGMKTDWRNEDEYRYRGNFDLSDSALEKVICFCHTQAQARKISREYGLKAIAFCAD